MMLIIHNLDNVEGRYHYHRGKKKISPAPTPPEDSPSPPPSNSPSVPSDPYPNDPPGDSPSGCIFDVRSFGAVGDGSADDTDAFVAAWKEACAVESGVVLVPEDHCFEITSTIFTGPCKPGLVFQVRMLVQFHPSSHHFPFAICYCFITYNMVECKCE